jgi:hypothetical protein
MQQQSEVADAMRDLVGRDRQRGDQPQRHARQKRSRNQNSIQGVVDAVANQDENAGGAVTTMVVAAMAMRLPGAKRLLTAVRWSAVVPQSVVMPLSVIVAVAVVVATAIKTGATASGLAMCLPVPVRVAAFMRVGVGAEVPSKRDRRKKPRRRTNHP